VSTAQGSSVTRKNGSFLTTAECLSDSCGSVLSSVKDVTRVLLGSLSI
jgi:hypothetical protein